MSGAARTSSARRELDLVVLGATGFTGRLVVARLAALEQRADAAGDPFPTWAVAGRDGARLGAVLDSLPDSARHPEVIAGVDVNDTASLRALAVRVRVLLNAVGPYTSTAEAVVAACVGAGTHYADLSGELPLLRRVVDLFDAPARAAGCQVVQMAGWEALPPDIAAMHACRVASGVSEGWGPGASAPVQQLDVVVRFRETPRVSGAVSAGTLGSIVEIFSDPDARIVGDPAGLLPEPDGADAKAVARRSPLRVRPFVVDDRLVGPMVPVAFLNPPIVHRTAALLARASSARHLPARVREGVDHGPARPRRASRATQEAQSILQRGVAVATRLPLRVRRLMATAVRTRLPPAGTGPAAAALVGWRWDVVATATTGDGRHGTARVSGTGHPGYTATAAMLVALGLHLAERERTDPVAGVVTPAIAFGPALSPHLATPELSLHVG